MLDVLLWAIPCTAVLALAWSRWKWYRLQADFERDRLRILLGGGTGDERG